MLYRASDTNGLGERVLSLPSGVPLAAQAFQAHARAMCWLTNPVAADVIENYHASGPTTGSPDAASSGWLAVVTRDSRTCFDLDGGGVGRVLALMGEPATGLCLLLRFARPAPAYGWLASDATGDVFGALWSVTGQEGGPVQVMTPSRGSHNHVAASLCSAGEPMAAGIDAAATAGERRAPTGLWTSQPAGPPPSFPSCSGELPAKRPRPEEKPAKRVHPDEELPPDNFPRGGGGDRGRRRHSSSLEDVDAGGGIDLAPRVEAGRSGWSFGGHASSPAVSTAAASSDEKLLVAVSGSSLGKRHRDSAVVSQFTARNPAWIAPEPGAGTFSAANLSKIVQESSLAWKLRDLSDAANTFKAGSCSVDAPEAVAARAALAEGFTPNKLSDLPATRATLRGTSTKTVSSAEGSWDGASASAVPSIETASPASSTPSSPQPPPVDASPVNERLPAAHIAADVGAVDLTSPLPVTAPVQLPQGPIGQLAAVGRWGAVYERLFERRKSTFVTGGPGVGKTFFLKQFAAFLRGHWPAAGAVVVVAPTGSAARSAGGQTFHSFFGFVRDYHVQSDDPAAEATRLLGMGRWAPIARRLKGMRALLIDEISMVPADKLDVMYEMIQQSQTDQQPPCVLYVFGDFLQLHPTRGSMAFTAKCWRSVFSTAILELTLVYRQTDGKLIRAIQDARWGLCTPDVEALMKERAVTEEEYKRLEHTVLHIMPRHQDVTDHNKKCLLRLSGGRPLPEFTATHEVQLDKNREPNVRPCPKSSINPRAPEAALLECVAPARVAHCLQARVMLTTNRLDAIGLYHGSIGFIKAYLPDGVPVVRFENHTLPPGVARGTYGVQDVGEDWLEVSCPPVEYEARILSAPGWVVVRRQVPFVLGWGITTHRCQSLTMSEVVIDVARAFGAGMVHAAMSRVPASTRLHVKSFSKTRLFADEACMHFYRTATLL